MYSEGKNQPFKGRGMGVSVYNRKLIDTYK